MIMVYRFALAWSQEIAIIPRERETASHDWLLHAVLVSPHQRFRIDHIREAVAVGIAQELQVEAVALANVGESEAIDLVPLPGANGAFDLGGDLEQPFGIEAFDAGVHALHHEMLV